MIISDIVIPSWIAKNDKACVCVWGGGSYANYHYTNNFHLMHDNDKYFTSLEWKWDIHV